MIATRDGNRLPWRVAGLPSAWSRPKRNSARNGGVLRTQWGVKAVGFLRGLAAKRGSPLMQLDNSSFGDTYRIACKLGSLLPDRQLTLTSEAGTGRSPDALFWCRSRFHCPDFKEAVRRRRDGGCWTIPAGRSSEESQDRVCDLPNKHQEASLSAFSTLGILTLSLVTYRALSMSSAALSVAFSISSPTFSRLSGSSSQLSRNSEKVQIRRELLKNFMLYSL